MAMLNRINWMMHLSCLRKWQRDDVSWFTMLSKAGDMDITRMLFDKMAVNNLVSWTMKRGMQRRLLKHFLFK
ncbi:hypothetical protein QVD17_26934 [Tagetes erecta]|uniref:Uncharacterized protein n=1 Tax=Tagetes erecta TaxID=13708 RepID=A0AAD8K7G3_TARER|nr:hypothetical protein QVD17_26934 [Tagetes erecta]